MNIIFTILEFISWHLRYILDSIKLNEFAEDDLESLYCLIEDYYPKKEKGKNRKL